MALPQSFDGARVTVMGLGRFGGGVGVTRWLAAQGADLLVTDLEPAERLERSITEIQDLIDDGAVELRLGEHNVSDFTTPDAVVANPAVPKPWENRFLRAAEAAGVPITTEIRLLVERLPNRYHTVGVTGTAGKSTTSAMIAHALRAQWPGVKPAGRVWLGGNIGGSLLPQLDEMTADDVVVLELSSAQLHWLGQEKESWAPHVAVLTNFAPNHLDWHGDVEHYRASKMRIFEMQDPERDVAIAHRLEPWLERMHRRLRYAADAPPVDMRLSIPGRHNVENARLASLAVSALLGRDATAESMTSLATFPGLPHRLQFVAEHAGVRTYNDSKCTTPEGAALALAAFDEPGWPGVERVRLICGGYDKGVDLGALVRAGAACRSVHAFGATGPAIAEGVRALGGSASGHAELAGAVAAGARDLGGGGVLLLSPGCASWDQFANFEARGEAFVKLARGALGGGEG